MSDISIKIRRTSSVFRWIFIVFLVLLPVIHVVAWLHPDSVNVSGSFAFFMGALPKGIKILHPLDFSTKFYGMLVGAIPLIFIECILYFLVRLFRLYEQGIIFSIRNVKYFKKIGYSLLIYQLIDIVCSGLLSLILTMNNPPGFRTISMSFSGTNLTVLLTSFIIILISWIMTEGCRLHEEQSLTI